MTDAYDSRLSIVGEGDPVVLVPGMDGTGRLFYRQLPLLARSHRVATYALRDDARDMRTLVGDLAAVIDAAAPPTRRALIVGESFGGALSLSMKDEIRDRLPPSQLVIFKERIEWQRDPLHSNQSSSK